MKKNNPAFRLISPSTIKFLRTAKQKKQPFESIVHGYIYSRWIYIYIGIAIGTHPLTKWFNTVSSIINRFLPKVEPTSEHSVDIASHTIADGYHGKAIPLKTAKELISIQEPIRIEDLEHVIPYIKARALLMEAPDQIAVLECPCRAAREHPCEPLDVCMLVGEPFVSFVLEHHPQKSRKITRDEAVEILQAEDRRGHVHHAFFKDAMLGGFYAICNCCSCCCGAMQAHRHGIPMLDSSGYVANIDQDNCIQCGTCQASCPFSAIELNELEEMFFVNQELCMGCGICTGQCAQEAIQLELEPSKGIPLDISAYTH